jgi:rSAM-associated Gly-rich repeat protein
MSQNRRSLPALARLLPSGALGLSVGLAAVDAGATAVAEPNGEKASVSERLQSLRTDVSGALEQYRKDGEPFVAVDPDERLAWWGNGGWRNGGWRNGGWGNGGWHNGWHNW